MKPNTLNQHEVFTSLLSAQIERVGGIMIAADICGVSYRTLKNWIEGVGKPTLATRYGAIKLLSEHTVKTG